MLSAAAAMFFTACEPASNAPANISNTNANAVTTGTTAPTADALLAMDKQANEAWVKGDAKFFEDFLSDKYVGYDGGQRSSKSDLAKMIVESKCDVKSWSLDDPQMAMIDGNTAIVSYKGTWDGTCSGPDGKAMKLPSPTRGASVYIRDGDKWKGVFHSETVIIDPKNPPPPPAASDKKEEPMKETAKMDDAKKDDKMASNSNAAPASAPAKPTPSANTDALVKLHTSGWEAWKAKDAKKFDEMITTDIAIVDPFGTWVSGKSDVIKHWTEMKCDGVTKVGVSDGFASALSPTVELLTLTGTSDGTCEGQKNGPLYQAAIYVKEGDAWKLAFMVETPKM